MAKTVQMCIVLLAGGGKDDDRRLRVLLGPVVKDMNHVGIFHRGWHQNILFLQLIHSRSSATKTQTTSSTFAEMKVECEAKVF